MEAEYIQISVLNHKNFMPETLLSIPSKLAILGYALTGTDEWSWTFDFIFDDEARNEPSDTEIEKWLYLSFFEIEIERYEV